MATSDTITHDWRLAKSRHEVAPEVTPLIPGITALRMAPTSEVLNIPRGIYINESCC